MDPEIVDLCVGSHKLLESFTLVLEQSPLQINAACVDTLQDLCDLLTTAINKTENSAALEDAFLVVKCFSAIVFYTQNNFGVRMGQFLDWIHTIQNTLFDFESVVLTSAPNWELVYTCLISGRFKDTVALIDKLGDSPEIQDLKTVIEHYPLKSQNYQAFMVWRSHALAVRQKIQQSEQLNGNGDVFEHANVKLVAAILCGDEQIIKQLSKNWILGVSGMYIFNDPSPNLLGEVFNNLNLPTLTDAMDTATWELGCRHILESKLVMALCDLESLDPTCALLISELCGAYGLLDAYQVESGVNIREVLALRYAGVLFDSERLVPYALDLLENINTDGAREFANNQLRVICERYPQFHETCIDLADNLQLPELSKQLCDDCANYHLESADFGRAMVYFYRGENYPKVNETAKDFFEFVLMRQGDLADNLEALELSKHLNDVDQIDLPSYVKSCLAPAMVLMQFLEARRVQNAAIFVACLNGLLECSKYYLEYLPLLIVLATSVSSEGGLYTRSNTTMLMNGLDIWDNSSDELKRQSLECIERALNSNEWSDIFPLCGPADLVWHLRRQLAREAIF